MAMIFCYECGAKYSADANKCPKCGAPNHKHNLNNMQIDKSPVIYTVLAFFLGVWGVHKFYAGKTGQGIAMLLMGTIGIALIIPVIVSSIWAFVDFIIGLCNLNNPKKLFAK